MVVGRGGEKKLYIIMNYILYMTVLSLLSVDGLYFALKSQAETTNSSLSSLTASLCCTKLSAILKSKPADTLLFSEDERVNSFGNYVYHLSK